jgi:tetratricopeptide (TPR) repeat protein
VTTLRFRVLQSLPILAMRNRDYGLAIRYAHQALTWARQTADRYHEENILLDLALAEQFAGLYAQAVTHNQAALAIAEEMGDADHAALLKANLCLTLRQQGELDAALGYGQAAIASLRTLGNRRIEGQARNRVGHTLLALERWTDAAAAYTAALVVWEPTQHPNRYEALAGRAVALVHLDGQEEAGRLVHEVLEFVATQDLVGIVEPVLLLLNCATVLTVCAEPAQAAAVYQRAHGWVQTVASRISDETVRAAFLARPDQQRLKSRLASTPT